MQRDPKRSPGVVRAEAPRSTAGTTKQRNPSPFEAASLGPPPGVQWGDKFFVHVSYPTRNEYYFREAVAGVPGQWITVESVADGFVEEEVHVASFYPWERPDIAHLLEAYDNYDLVTPKPHGAGWIQYCETVDERKNSEGWNGRRFGAWWKRRRPLATNQGVG